jgi:Domain of unknown function (DUF4382)
MKINTTGLRAGLGRTSLMVALLALGACGGGGGDGGISGTGVSTGTLRLALTDAPACGYSEVNVTVQKVRVHQNASAAEGDTGWSEVVLNPARRVDLNKLTNGVLEELGQTTLPAGKYTQLRLVLAGNGSAPPYANSVVPTGSSETPLDTPSALQTGLKLNVDITVEPDKRADFVIDFDACKSVVKRGNSGQYNLKPVLTATARLSDAGMRVIGYVMPALANGNTSVSVQFNGEPVKATPPDATGQFVLYPVPAGTYDLVVTAPGRVTAVMTGVPVVNTAYTIVNSAAVPIAPAATASAPRAASGTVTPATATVRATQMLTGGPKVEVAWAPVDALNGSFTFALPMDAAVKTAYVPNPTTLNFVADAGVPGLYSIEATSAGVTKPLAIDTKAVVPPLVISFP